MHFRRHIRLCDNGNQVSSGEPWLKHVLSCDWRRSLIFLVRPCVLLWRRLSTVHGTVTKQSSLKLFFFSHQILRLTNNSSFFGCNQYDADPFALAPRYCLSPALIGMNSSVSKVRAHWLCQCEPHFSERRDFFSQPSPIKHAVACLQEALEYSLPVWGNNLREETWSGAH